MNAVGQDHVGALLRLPYLKHKGVLRVALAYPKFLPMLALGRTGL